MFDVRPRKIAVSFAARPTLSATSIGTPGVDPSGVRGSNMILLPNEAEVLVVFRDPRETLHDLKSQLITVSNSVDNRRISFETSIFKENDVSAFKKISATDGSTGEVNVKVVRLSDSQQGDPSMPVITT